jgi:hypothetical protein
MIRETAPSEGGAAGYRRNSLTRENVARVVWISRVEV